MVILYLIKKATREVFESYKLQSDNSTISGYKIDSSYFEVKWEDEEPTEGIGKEGTTTKSKQVLFAEQMKHLQEIGLN